MRNYKWVGVLLFLLGFCILAVTFIKEPVGAVDIPFKTPSGITGMITISIPEVGYAGDQEMLIAKVRVTPISKGQSPLALRGWLDTTVEDVHPRGEVVVNIKPDITTTFSWKFRAAHAVIYPGAVWLLLDSEAGSELLLAREYDYEPRRFWGTQVLWVRLITGGLSLLGIVFFIIRYRKEGILRKRQ